MAVTKLYPAQVTMMTTKAQKEWIKRKSEEAAAAGVLRSESQVCRDLFDAGKRLEEHAKRSGLTVEQILTAVESQIPTLD